MSDAPAIKPPDTTDRLNGMSRAESEGYVRKVFRQVEIPKPETAPSADEPVHAEPDADRAFSITDLLGTPPDPRQTLLGDRFLCRTNGMLFVGPSGIGKSSASMMMDLSWSCGREAFGIVPAGPLRILCIQAENDLGDLHEMATGAVDALRLDDDDLALVRDNFRIIRHQTSVGIAFLAWLAIQLELHKPDLVRLDPLLAYLGEDPTDTKGIGLFCRGGLNTLIDKHNCGLILNHHTPKTNYRDTSEWKPSDWMYAGGGAADLTNWARAVLVVDGTNDPAVFRFIAAKRGRRIGWMDDSGAPVQERYFSHSSEWGKIEWIDTPAHLVGNVTPRKGGPKLPTAEEFIELLPRPEILNPAAALLSMAELELRAKEGRFTKNGLAGLRDQLRREGKIYVTQGGGRARPVLVGRAEIEGLIKLIAEESKPVEDAALPTLPTLPDAPPGDRRTTLPTLPTPPLRGLGRERAKKQRERKTKKALGTVSPLTTATQPSIAP
ncbi:MAG: AAA family ATPase [Verrucomicrobiales bacterium]